MRYVLTIFLFGAAVAAVAAQPPFPIPRDRDRDRERGHRVSRESRELVNAWSLRFFGMGADDSSVAYWGGQLDRGNSPDQVLAAILGHSSYYAHVGGTPRALVLVLLRELTGRDPSRREFDYWMGRLLHAGGDNPSDEDRTDLVYDMLRRYPQGGPPPRADDDYDYRGPGYRPDRP